MDENKISLISRIISESKAYEGMESIERMVEKGRSLAGIPLWPLYVSFHGLTPAHRAEYLPTLSKEQRQGLLDLDLWEKDDLDIHSFSQWVVAYNLCPSDDIKKEFVTGEEFYLFLKAQFNIWSFDAEDPEYPDHDYYFLTEDNLLLFEYAPEFQYVDEVKALIRELYAIQGVEKAYSYLFKLVTDSFLNAQEDLYQAKKTRLAEFGMVDYYEALEFENVFPSLVLLNSYLTKKCKSLTPQLDLNSKTQVLHRLAAIPYQNQADDFDMQLQKITDNKRLDYLQFSFLRLVNGRLSFDQSLKRGTSAIGSTGKVTLTFLKLGMDYLLKNVNNLLSGSELNLFQQFGPFHFYDFSDLYKVGHTLTVLMQSDLKKQLRTYNYEEDQSQNFLGQYWIDFLDQLYSLPTLFKGQPVVDYKNFEVMGEQVEFFKKLLPFIKRYQETLYTQKKNAPDKMKLFLNFTYEEMNFESLLLTSLALNVLGESASSDIYGIGISIDHFKKIVKILSNNKMRKDVVDRFSLLFGQDLQQSLSDYIQNIYNEHLAGYDFLNMEDEEFRHVGGIHILS